MVTGTKTVKPNMEERAKSSEQSEAGKRLQFRQILPQVLATTAESSMMLSFGMLLAFPSVLISVLTNELNPEKLRLTLEQASWYGGLSFIFQPPGCILSGAILQTFGCKKLMILINLPVFAGWMLTYYAKSVFDLYISSALFGFVLGLMEVPTVRYIGEIAHPSLRSILTTYSLCFLSLGYVVVYSLASLTDWRHIALIMSSVPIICTFALLWLPETPMWLMSKGHPKEALRSLQWLRGRISNKEVEEEFNKLEIYAKKKKRSQGFLGYRQILDDLREEDEGEKQSLLLSRAKDYGADAINEDESADRIQNIPVDGETELDEYFDESSLSEKWREVIRRETLIPMSKGVLLFTTYCLCGIFPMGPYVLKIYDELKLPVDADKLSAFQAMINLCNCFLFMLIIQRVGKKQLLLVCSSLAILWLLLLSLFIHGLLTDLNNVGTYDTVIGWITLMLFVFHSSCLSFGVRSIIWIYVSEILPFKGRGVATGIIVSYFYLIIFIGVKFYPTLQQEFNLDGTLFLFAIAAIPCVIAVHFFIPETEGRFLADIESEITQKTREKN